LIDALQEAAVGPEDITLHTDFAADGAIGIHLLPNAPPKPARVTGPAVEQLAALSEGAVVVLRLAGRHAIERGLSPTLGQLGADLLTGQRRWFREPT